MVVQVVVSSKDYQRTLMQQLDLNWDGSIEELDEDEVPPKEKKRRRL